MKYHLPESRYIRRRSTTDIVIHAAWTRPWQHFGMSNVRAWHLARGWIDVGYHLGIRRDGTLEVGRPLWAQGAHLAGHNHTTVGILLMGGKHLNEERWAEDSEENFTLTQMRTLQATVAMLREVYPRVTVKGHRDYLSPTHPKRCPAFDVGAWFKREF